MRKIVGIGETVFDIIFKNDVPQKGVPGGSTFNALISLGRTAGKEFGVSVLMVSETGDDHVGDVIASFMSRNGVSTDALTRRSCSQSHISLAFLNENNDANYEFYKDHAHASLDLSKVDIIDFQKDDIVLFGSYFAVNPVIRDYTRSLLQKARKAGAIIYYDINFRKNHIKDLPQIISNIVENYGFCDFVRGSSEDLENLYGGTDIETVYASKIKDLCPNLIVTRGAGATEFFRADGKRFQFPVTPIETVSTIGAGDNFNAGFIYGLIRADVHHDDCRIIDEKTLTSLIHTATLFSANVCRSFDNYVDPDFAASLIR